MKGSHLSICIFPLLIHLVAYVAFTGQRDLYKSYLGYFHFGLYQSSLIPASCKVLNELYHTCQKWLQ
jgi:hypothetical protein